MNYSSLEEVYGKPFGQRVPVSHQRKDVKEEPIQKPEFSSLADRASKNVEKNKSVVESVMGSLPLDTTPETENFRVEQPRREMAREKFTTSQPANIVTDFDQTEKISRILRLIEQNKTGYERPATQDMLLYIATGVFSYLRLIHL